jgi:L-ascorbate metabolism protein UlaG (beta-lactamase superfamily)
MQITWLGHATVYMVTARGTRILLDGWVDNNPACPNEWHELVRTHGVDIILLTHGHADHSADVARVQQATGALVFCQYDVVEWLTWQDVPADKVVGFNKGGTIRHNDVRITMTAAQHSSSWPTAAGARTLGSEVGFVVRADDDITVYASGDTAVMADMAIIADLYAPDVAMLPIGDRFTMGPYEAAYALKLLRSAAVLPIHHSTFPLLTGTPAQLVDELAARGVDCEVLMPVPGQTVSRGR